MNTMDLEPDDGRLAALLRQARPAPDLPPRFQEGVWRRLEQAEEVLTPAALFGAWVDRVAASILRPRVVVTGFTAVLAAGLLVGVISGAAQAHDSARAAYVASVAPNAIH
jgi:hypothetical protein